MFTKKTDSKKEDLLENKTAPHLVPEKEKAGSTTRVIVKYDVGFGNSLFIRGKGANLNWERGVALRNVKPDEWHWEINLPFNACEFKVLINDKQFEQGENHPLTSGSAIQYTPKF